MVLQTNGVRRVPRDTSVAAHKNVGDAERVISVAAGAVLAVYGLDRQDVRGGLLAVVGGELIRRGATGHCLLYEALNVSTARDATHHGLHRDLPASRAATVRASRAVKIEHSVTVMRPAAELYAFWRDPANVPRVVEFIQSVETLSETTVRWRARGPGGMTIEWDAQIVNDIPNELLAWKSVGDADIPNAGSMHFRPAPDGKGTEVRFVLEYEPPAGHLGAWLVKLVKANPEEQLRTALLRFKQLAEASELLTGEAPTPRR